MTTSKTIAGLIGPTLFAIAASMLLTTIVLASAPRSQDRSQ